MFLLLLLSYCSEVLTKTGLIIFICFLPLLFSYSQFGLLFLLIHTASHIPVTFFLSPHYILVFWTHVSPSLLDFCLPISFPSCACLSPTCSDLTVFGLSAWYAVHSHTWCGIEVPTEQQLHLCMLCFCVCDNYHGCQQRGTGGGWLMFSHTQMWCPSTWIEAVLPDNSTAKIAFCSTCCHSSHWGEKSENL